MTDELRRSEPAARRIPLAAWLLLGLLALAGYALAGEHRPHAVAMLPYLLLVACPLLHLFHGHGHGGHRHHARALEPHEEDTEPRPRDGRP